ncbi:acyltransferase [Candidatus Eisenbacteria bacterium]|uniref:Acyltransferase n=1 Tax=Eiseniibacteriota bacterium TaxID=2212470 RepID=A0ABV6YP21_UNCEI
MKTSGPEVKMGEGSVVDVGAIIGYPASRGKDVGLIEIGENARIRSGTVIYGGVRIGKNLQTGHNVVIREENEIGDDFAIWNNTVIDYGCRIGVNVKIHCNCYIAQFTIVEDNAFMAPGVTIANDLHPGCEFSSKCMRGPHIGKGAQIGVNVTILPFVKIGEGCLIGGGSVVSKDLPPFSLAYGNPARVVRDVRELECTKGLTDRPYNIP